MKAGDGARLMAAAATELVQPQPDVVGRAHVAELALRARRPRQRGLDPGVGHELIGAVRRVPVQRVAGTRRAAGRCRGRAAGEELLRDVERAVVDIGEDDRRQEEGQELLARHRPVDAGSAGIRIAERIAEQAGAIDLVGEIARREHLPVRIPAEDADHVFGRAAEVRGVAAGADPVGLDVQLDALDVASAERADDAGLPGSGSRRPAAPTWRNRRRDRSGRAT